MKKIIFLLAAIAALSSCTITKRHYAPGYHVEWKSLRSKEVTVGSNEIDEVTKDQVTINDPAESIAILTSNQNEDVILIDGKIPPAINLQFQRDTTIVDEKEQEDFHQATSEEKGSPQESAKNPEIDQSCYINKMALLGFILTISSLYLIFTFIPGVIFSFIGYKQIKEGKGIGLGLAKTGIAFGFAGVLALLAFVVYIIAQLVILSHH
jgi:hypothetical protein